MQLREYQQRAVEAVYDHLRTKSSNPCVVLPTGAGKSLVIAKIAADTVDVWGGRVLVIAHVKELLEQNAEKIRSLCPTLNVGLYSAGLGKREQDADIVVAGIQSIHKIAFDLGRFDVVLIDEAHLIPPDGDGMYRTFLSDSKLVCPHQRIIGLTATPYRLKTGWICGPENILHEVCCEVGVKELIADGYLSRLISKEPIQLDTSGLHKRGGEFVADEAEALMLSNVRPAVKEIAERTQSRRSVLVFCQSVEHAVQVTDLLREATGERVELVTGETSPAKRAEYLRDFRSGAIRYLTNVNVLTTGFDAPNTDCVILLRPTLSPGLYYQMVGRGFRLSPDTGKTECLVLDFAGNVRLHGPVDQIKPKPRNVSGGGGEAPVKTCPECETVIHAAYSECPECGYVFPDSVAKHDPTAGTTPVVSGEIVTAEYPVIDVKYGVHWKRGSSPDDPKTLRVDYRVNLILWVSEWVCIEHDGYAGAKARAWWKARSNDPFPASAERAVDIANGGGLAIPRSIVVEEKGGEKWPRVRRVDLGPKPEGVPVSDEEDDFEFPVPEGVEEEEVDWANVPF